MAVSGKSHIAHQLRLPMGNCMASSLTLCPFGKKKKKKKKNRIVGHIKKCEGDFLHGPVFKTPYFLRGGPGFDPWSGN